MIIVAEEALLAAENGNIEILRQYDSNSLTDRICDGVGCNCLHYAARQGGADLLQFLVKERNFSGHKRSNIGATAAHDAAAAGNLEALQWLLQYGGCNVDDQDGTGATVLHLAARFHHTHVIEWLLDTANADVSKRTASNGLALHFAVVGGDYDAVKLLLDEDPSSVSLQLSNGATVTYLAAQEGHIEILRLLIQDYRGNVRVKAYDGMSCVHAAAQSGHLDCVRFLVDEEKCNANDRDFDGATALHYAASQGHALVIDWLMKLGGAKITLDNLGGSPLHNAAENNQEECIKVLISNGCSTEITDNNGLTAAELARKCYNNNCAYLIETFKPQSQFVIDEDVAYLHSVQSPRPAIQTQAPPLTNGFVSYPARIQQDPVLNGVLMNGTHGHTRTVHATIETVTNVYSKLPGSRTPVRSGSPGNQTPVRSGLPGNRTPVRGGSPVSHQQRQEEAVVNGTTTPDIESDEDTCSVSAHADSDELPVGIPRNFSEDWCVDDKQDTGKYSNSASSSSLSSLSQQDGGVKAQEVQIDRITHSASGYRKSAAHVLSSTTQDRISVESKPIASYSNNNRFGYGLLEQKEPKSVSFQTKTEYIANKTVSKIVTEMEESNDIEKQSSGDSVAIMEKEKSNGVNGDSSEEGKAGDEDDVNSGSVEQTVLCQNVSSIYSHTAQQNIRSHVSNLEMLKNNTHDLVHGKPTVISVGDVPQSEKPNDLVNGTSTDIPDCDISESEKISALRTSSPYIPPPLPPQPASVADMTLKEKLGSQIDQDDFMKSPALSNTGNGNQTSVIPPPPPPPSPHYNQINTALLHPLPPAQLGTGNQPASVPAAPPPPPPGIGNQSGNVPASGSFYKPTVNSVPEEIKRKSASLPARSTGLFTAEMIQSQRSTLTPAKTREIIENDVSRNDFIAELKQATKGPALRKTSKSIEPGTKPLTPAMVFTSGQKTVVKDNSAGSSKESKIELNGEWDPKNFVDKVPNRDDLPAWKLQLQARQIAEKTMKETLEKRKVEERESRFKDMPAWKRALVEKKEAEARAAEEKRLQEQEQQAKKKVSMKRVPNISVTSTPGEKGKLAPWQQELQHS